MHVLLKRSLTGLFLLFLFTANAQLIDPLKWWSASQKQVSDSEYVITFHCDVPKGWHTYSQYSDSNGATPMAFTYTASVDYKREGKTIDDSCITKYDSVFKCVVKYFPKPCDFTQKIIIRNFKGFTLKGNIYFQACNEGQCLPPKEYDFAVNIPQTAPPKKESSGYLWIWILGFLGGLTAVFTPCVFSMIPLTISFFTKRASAHHKKATSGPYIYAFSIVLIYVLLGVLITAIWGSSGLYVIASNGWVNLIFFLVFLIFGFSFLGAFEITLPNSWVNKTDNISEKGGIIGIFFMALTLCIVSFSCTGPILGALLAGVSQSGGYWSLMVGMFGFSVAMALPFALFAAVPNLLAKMPKSGGWLNSIKVVLGLLEIAFSLKFLSNADLTGLHIRFLHIHFNGPMGILPRNVFIALWIVIFAITGFYLLGKLKFHHDSDLKHLSTFRLILAVLAFSFSFYLVPGLFGAPLKLLSGFPPPLTAYDNEGWVLSSSSSEPINKADTAKKVIAKTPSAHGCPPHINCLHDYEEAIATAKQTNKPIMIDFTGNTCVNCRKMEETVWSDPSIYTIINADYVLVSLYVDDQNELPDDKKSVSKFDGSKIETLGDKWTDMETNLYKSNTQPLYVLVDADGNMLADKRGYTPDISEYKQFLEEGKTKFKSKAANNGQSPVFKSNTNVSLN
ncbi:MAG TPA: cytochrome c biogenesis protein CcdA [Bacteroidia bacterium]|jgi:thiol:disulfide interchange protein|nr:cytochrome c biogenesis protein CcdA [Bacteroidia bacterium]